MRASSTSWLKGLLAGLFALAMLSAPADQARSVLARAAFTVAYAMPDGALPDICGDHGEPAGHGEHAGLPACLACILMTAPGLPAPAAVAPARMAAPAAAGLVAPDLPDPPAPAWQPRRARAPPPVRLA